MDELVNRKSMAERIGVSIRKWDQIVSAHPDMPCVVLGERTKRWNPAKVIRYLEQINMGDHGEPLPTRADVAGAIYRSNG